MKKLNEKKIIELMNSKKGKDISEDVEIFRLGNEQCAVCVDTLVESTDIPKGSRLSDISRKSIVASLSDFAAKSLTLETILFLDISNNFEPFGISVLSTNVSTHTAHCSFPNLKTSTSSDRNFFLFIISIIFFSLNFFITILYVL